MFKSGALSIKPFRDLWLGQAVSQVGDSLYYVTFMFMVQKITNSTAMVGYVGATEMLPLLLLSPYAGVLADRIDRKKIMLFSDLACGLILIGLAAVTLIYSLPPVWSIFASAFLLSSVRAFFMPTKSAAIPALVPPEQLMSAMSVSNATQSFMQLGGLALSASVLGVLYHLSRTMFFVSAVGLNSVSFFVSAFFIAKLPAILPDRGHGHETHPFRDFTDGLSFMKTQSVLLVLMVLSVFLNLFISPFFVVYVAANNAWFGGKPATLAGFEFFFIAGMVSGNLMVGKVKIRKPGLSFVYGLVIVGAGVAAMAYSRNIVLFTLWNLVCGIALPFGDVPVRTYLQLVVPDMYRGRVNSALMMLATSTMPISMSLAGLLIERAGLVNAFLLMGLGLGGVALCGLLSPSFRAAEMPTERQLA